VSNVEPEPVARRDTTIGRGDAESMHDDEPDLLTAGPQARASDALRLNPPARHGAAPGATSRLSRDMGRSSQPAVSTV
jgi:hypothetical protein